LIAVLTHSLRLGILGDLKATSYLFSFFISSYIGNTHWGDGAWVDSVLALKDLGQLSESCGGGGGGRCFIATAAYSIGVYQEGYA
jgi:hypothetical protein